MPHVDFPSGFRLSTGWHAGRCLSGFTGRALGHKAPVAPCLASSGVSWSQREAQHYQLLSLQGNIVVLVHGSEDSEDEENKLVVTSLCHHSNLILWVEGLATGFCKDVHGEVRHDGALGHVAMSHRIDSVGMCSVCPAGCSRISLVYSMAKD